jgi:hypothetical protein
VPNARSGPSADRDHSASGLQCHEYVAKSLYKGPGTFCLRGCEAAEGVATSKAEDFTVTERRDSEDELFWREFLRSRKSLGWPGG